MDTFENQLRRALMLELPYPERPPFETGTPASVLILFGDYKGNRSVLIIKRAESLGTHQGQVAFPGGILEPEERDVLDGGMHAAIRETEEEVGIPGSEITVLGQLPGLWTVTGFWVTPFVGVLHRAAEEVPLKLNPTETAAAAWIQLAELRASETYRREFKKFGEVNYPIHVFQVGGFRIWGATGSMIRNLLDRLAVEEERMGRQLGCGA